MRPDEIKQAWDRLQQSARYGTQIYRPEDVYELRAEMKVMERAIELMAKYEEKCPNFMYEYPGKHCASCPQDDSKQIAECWIDMYRHDAIVQLKKEE